MIELDGAKGGGQLLRSALSLSCVLQEPFRMTNIRGARGQGGLKAQHLACVNACASITGAEVKGAKIGGSEIEFSPQAIAAGQYDFSVGTAGSVSLVAQCVFPILASAKKESSFTVSGGTHVSHAPSTTYLEGVFLPLASQFGLNATARTARHGFFPRGGGLLECAVQPAAFRGARFEERGNLSLVEAFAVTSALPENVAQRMLNWSRLSLVSIPATYSHADVQAVDPGAYFSFRVAFEKSLAGFDALGAKGLPAPKVADAACNSLHPFLKSNACVEEHAADQLLLYAALAGKGSFTTTAVTDHMRTNLEVIKAFLPNVQEHIAQEEKRVLIVVES